MHDFAAFTIQLNFFPPPINSSQFLTTVSMEYLSLLATASQFFECKCMPFIVHSYVKKKAKLIVVPLYT